MPQQALIEFQAFKDNNNRFIIKEFALVSEQCQIHIIFKPPYSKDVLASLRQRTVRWLERYYHHIKWEDGCVVYNERLIRKLCEPFSVIFTKGSEKANFLKQFHPNVQEHYLPYEFTCNHACLLHQNPSRRSRCALAMAYSYYTGLFPVTLVSDERHLRSLNPNGDSFVHNSICRSGRRFK